MNTEGITNCYKINNGLIINNDCLISMDELIKKGIKVDTIIADIPFGVTKNKWDAVIPFDKMWDRLNEIIKPNGAIILFGSEPFSSALRMSNIKNYKYDWIWDKVLKTGHLNSKIMPMGRYENIMVFGNGKGKLNYYPIMEEGPPQHKSNRYINKTINSSNYGNQRFDFEQKDGNTLKFPSNILVFQKIHPSKCIHPTEKPPELMDYLVKTYSKEGDIVLDFTAGVYTTCISADRLNRKWIGIDKEKRYCDIGKEILTNPL